MNDRDEWIDNRAEELAQKNHNLDLEELPEDTRQKYYDQAVEDYELAAARADAYWEAQLEREWEREHEESSPSS